MKETLQEASGHCKTNLVVAQVKNRRSPLRMTSAASSTVRTHPLVLTGSPMRVSILGKPQESRNQSALVLSASVAERRR